MAEFDPRTTTTSFGSVPRAGGAGQLARGIAGLAPEAGHGCGEVFGLREGLGGVHGQASSRARLSR